MTLAPLLLATMLNPLPKGPSFYPLRPDDPKAVGVERFAPRGDGLADDTAALQKALDATEGRGVVLLPEGRYRISRTLVVPPGVRLVGHGGRRPTILLGPSTSGFGEGERPMLLFVGRRGGPEPTIPPDAVPLGDFAVPNDANPGTFYSALSNVDLEIDEGNPAAVGVRGRYAQHCFLAHMEFRLRSGLAGVHDIGNLAEDLRFVGGEYGIVTRTPSPGWPFVLLDARFEGQTKAAILTRVTGLTLIRPSFRNVPTAVEVDADHSEGLWVQDARMEDVSGPAVVVSREGALRTQINLENVACRNVPTFARFRESGRTLPAAGPGPYLVRALSHGLRYASLDGTPKVETRFDAAPLPAMPPPAPSDVPALPPMAEWADLRALGAKGDGETDDTAALRKAVAEHRTVFLPQGRYRVTDTILLRPDTVLVGLNPGTTQIVLHDGTPAFAGSEGRPPFPGSPKALLETPRGGGNVVTGIGLDTGGDNPRAVAALWRAGAASMMDDVKFVGGHGGDVPIYNADHTGDPDPKRRWDSQYPSLWVTDGGGGTFKDLWTASTFAAAGMLVSDTDTPGRVYAMSSEHHVRHEVQVRDAAHWRFVGLQTEEERGESSACLPILVERSSDVLFANLNMYRVVSVVEPFPTAVRVADSRDVRFRGVHIYSNSKASFDDAIVADGVGLRQREIASLDVASPLRAARREESDSRVVRLATGFSNASGGAVAPNGDFAFVDARTHGILRWDVAKGVLTTVSDAPLSPVNLLYDRSGNLMVVSYAGRGVVYTIGKGETVERLVPQAAAPRPGATAVLPVGDWILGPELLPLGDGRGEGSGYPWHVVSPDGSTFLPVSGAFVDGALTWGVKLMDTIRAFGFARAEPGRPFYVTEESGMRTYAVDVRPDGTTTAPRLFCEQGGEGVAVGPDGRVYLAAGQVYVYSQAGGLLDTIRVPERPTQIAFGGPDGRTLFICARTSLYAVKLG